MVNNYYCKKACDAKILKWARDTLIRNYSMPTSPPKQILRYHARVWYSDTPTDMIDGI